MSERCPLRLTTYWDNIQSVQIPDVCQQRCGALWEDVMAAGPGEIVQVSPHSDECDIESEYIGMSLQRVRLDRFGSERLVSTWHECFTHAVVLDHEDWRFDCPNN